MRSLRVLNTSFREHPLTREAPLRAWKRFISWQLRSRFKGELIEPWVGGQSLAVRKGMTGATGNLYTGLHEFVDMSLLLHFLREGDLFFDIGGNVGTYTVLAAGICRARTWVFEPDPQAARDLARNVEVNNLGNLVTLYRVALGAQDGELSFTVGLDTTNHVATSWERRVQTVPARCLDSVAGESTPAMIKLDVEGYEEQVIRGAQALLKRPELKVIETEDVTPWLTVHLEQEGFSRAYYAPKTRTLSPIANGQHSANAIYVRDWSFVDSRVRSAPVTEVLGERI
jgi:FkbM family methyltransferase